MVQTELLSLDRRLNWFTHRRNKLKCLLQMCLQEIFKKINKEDIFPLPWKKVSYRKKRKTPSDTSEKLWSQVKICSSYTPPGAKVKYVQ